MRAELIGDSYLLDLAVDKPVLDTLCGVLLRTQIETYRRAGHIIDLSQEYVRRRISSFPRSGQIPNCYARCMRCGCLALLLDWVLMSYGQRHPMHYQGVESKPMALRVAGSFQRECPGDQRAQDMLIFTADPFIENGV